MQDNPNDVNVLLERIERARATKDARGELAGYQALSEFGPLSDQEWRRYLELARRCRQQAKLECHPGLEGAIPGWVFRHFVPDTLRMLDQPSQLDPSNPLSVLERRLEEGAPFASVAKEYQQTLIGGEPAHPHLQLRLALRRMVAEGEVRSEAAWKQLFLACQTAHGAAMVLAAHLSMRACRGSTWLRRNYLCLAALNDESPHKGLTELEQDVLTTFDPPRFEDVMQILLDLAGMARRIWWDHQQTATARQYWQSLIELASSIGPGDRNDTIRRYWIRIEYREGDVSLARQMMGALLAESKRQARSDVRLWLEAAWLEIGIKEPRHAHSVFQDALQAVSPTDLGRLLGEYERFVQEWGTVQDFHHFWHHIKAVKDPLCSAPPPPLSTAANNVPAEGRKRAKPAAPEGENRAGNAAAVEREPFDPYRTVFLSNLPFKASEAEILGFFAKEHGLPAIEAVLVLDKSGKSRGLAHLVLPSPEEAQAALRLDRSLFMGRPVFITRHQAVPRTHRERVEYPTGRDPKTLYVSRLSPETTQSDLQSLFADSIGLLDIRLIISKAGHFKGAAYVQFDSAEAASAALQAKDGQLVGGSKIRVQISDPEAGRAAVQALKMMPRTVRPGSRPRSHLDVAGHEDGALGTPTAGEEAALAKEDDNNMAVEGGGDGRGNEDFRRMFIGD